MAHDRLVAPRHEEADSRRTHMHGVSIRFHYIYSIIDTLYVIFISRLSWINVLDVGSNYMCYKNDRTHDDPADETGTKDDHRGLLHWGDPWCNSVFIYDAHTCVLEHGDGICYKYCLVRDHV